MDLETTFATLSNEDLLDLVYEQLQGGVALMDILDDAIQQIPRDEREDFTVAFYVLQAALETIAERKRQNAPAGSPAVGAVVADTLPILSTE